jgi:hypothetical protein
MATSSAEDVPRTLDFLSRNRRVARLARNVPGLYRRQPAPAESRARTIEQMRLINALCRFAELAGEQRGSIP